MRASKMRFLQINKIFLTHAFLFIFIILLVQLFLLVQSRIAHANQIAWAVETNPTVVSSVSTDSPSDTKYCQYRQSATIVGETQPKDVCVLGENNILQLGIYNQTGSIYPGVIRFTNDSNMYKVNNICSIYNACFYLAEKDILISKYYIYGPGQSRPELTIYKDFSKRLTKTTSEYNALVTEYNFNPENPDFRFISSDDYPWPVGSISASDNGEWVVFEARERAVMVLNTENLTVKRISIQVHRYNEGLSRSMEFDITNDGLHVAMMGVNVPALVFDVSDNCGDVPTDEQMQENKPITTPCPSKDLNLFSSDFIEGFSQGYNPKFNSDGGELTFYAMSYSAPGRFVSLRALNYPPPRQLDYLALGDSYSSGEGDTALTSSDEKYYLAWTDLNGDYNNGIPREKCHQSLRAWPFVLADSYNIAEDKKETVACSGATIGDIASSKATYEGQYNGGNPNIPRLQGFPNAEALKNTALQEFIPGRDRQVKFVERYKPKAITVGISGNDVGFARILESCIARVNIEDTCDLVSTDQGKAETGKLIANQYRNLVTLYTRLQEKSSNTKIYAVGYPKFISTGDNCGINVRLSDEERIMAESAVEYINDVISHAAKRSGVEYINTEDSLSGKRLCDTDKPYVTGIAFAGKNEKQESFHPNHQGNELMANYIKSELEPDSLISHRNCPLPLVIDFCPDPSISAPEPHPYFAEAMSSYDRSVKSEQLTNNTFHKTEPQNIQTDPFSLQPGSSVNVELHSNPISLGQYVVKQDGSLLESITIPAAVPAGYHTLHIYGSSYSGELIDLMQIIQVQGPEDDIDEDGIPDDIDPCLYIVSANIDSDFDGIDDACDLLIDNIEPYRVRYGDATKNENENYIYIERNVNATRFTGISDDYDPDNDGWAIVAASFNNGDAGEIKKFWVDSQKIPHVIIQTKDKVCFQFKPKSLLRVEPDNSIKLMREEKILESCN